MRKTTQTFLAIGSNLDPFWHIPHCLEQLKRLPDSQLSVVSAWYRTRPWGIEAQPEFINLVVGLTTRLSPQELLRETQAIERELQRVQGLKNGPRTIDLDILLFGERIVDEPMLRIPHPGLLLRDFMLTPLIEVAPMVIHPERGVAVSALTDTVCYRQIIERLPAQCG